MQVKFAPETFHQTAVFVHCSANASENYWERTTRLITSFNHNETIKADIYLVRGDGIVRWKPGMATSIQANKIVCNVENVRVQEYESWAKKQGYKLFVMATVPGAEVSTFHICIGQAKEKSNEGGGD